MNPPTPNLPEDCMGVIVSFIKDRDGLAAASRLCRHFRIRARERYLSAPYLILPVSHEWDFRIEGDDDDDVESDVKDKHSNVMVHLCNGKKGATTRSKEGLVMKPDYPSLDAATSGSAELSPFEWGGEMSIELFVKYKSFLEGSPIFDFCSKKYDPIRQTHEEDEVYVCNVNNGPEILFGIGRGGWERREPKFIKAGEFSLNEWTHVAVTCKSKDDSWRVEDYEHKKTTMRVYKNGLLAGETEHNGNCEPRVVTRDVQFIGKSTSVVDSPLDATLKFFRIYSKQLSSSEIKLLYDSQK